MNTQLAMFGAVEQPRTSRKEPDGLYEAVLKLRAAGRAVSRAGRHMHLVDGKRATDEQLIAAALAAKPKILRPRPSMARQADGRIPVPARSVTLYDLLAAYARVLLRRTNV